MGMIETDFIDNKTIEKIARGFAFSARHEFGNSITLTPPTTQNREDIGKPIVLANRLHIPDGPDSGHNALTIKPVDSDILSLPECHSLAFPLAKIVAKDVIDVYGWDKFTQSKIMFILQRTDVAPNQEHRKHFGQWHTHHQERSSFDLTYQFSTRCGTEFIAAGTRQEPFVLSAPTHALTRFGSEIIHRSPTNTTNETFSRAWGAFLVFPKNVQMNHISVNRTLKTENIDANLQNGADFKGVKPNIFNTPIPLHKAANRFIQPDIPQDLKAMFPNGLRFGFHSAVHGIYSAAIKQTTEQGLVIETKSFDGTSKITPLPQGERWPIQCELMKLGAHPIEPINA